MRTVILALILASPALARQAQPTSTPPNCGAGTPPKSSRVFGGLKKVIANTGIGKAIAKNDAPSACPDTPSNSATAAPAASGIPAPAKTSPAAEGGLNAGAAFSGTMTGSDSFLSGSGMLNSKEGATQIAWIASQDRNMETPYMTGYDKLKGTIGFFGKKNNQYYMAVLNAALSQSYYVFSFSGQNFTATPIERSQIPSDVTKLDGVTPMSGNQPAPRDSIVKPLHLKMFGKQGDIGLPDADGVAQLYLDPRNLKESITITHKKTDPVRFWMRDGSISGKGAEAYLLDEATAKASIAESQRTSGTTGLTAQGIQQQLARQSDGTITGYTVSGGAKHLTYSGNGPTWTTDDGRTVIITGGKLSFK